MPSTISTALHSNIHTGHVAIRAGWDTPDIMRRIAAGRRQPLARALGLHKKPHPHLVLDATAGLGRDAWVLAALGVNVTLLERNPTVFSLLDEAMQRAFADANMQKISNRINLQQADARTWLVHSNTPAADAIYLDPMYPDSGKSALPAKEMQLLRELTHGDTDANELLECACERTRRVVVKRPLRGPSLGERKVDAVTRGSQIRFDVYFNPGILLCGD